MFYREEFRRKRRMVSAPGVYREGDIVRHAEYGMGAVRSVSGPEEDAVVTVKFETGEKRFISRFAGLTKI